MLSSKCCPAPAKCHLFSRRHTFLHIIPELRCLGPLGVDFYLQFLLWYFPATADILVVAVVLYIRSIVYETINCAPKNGTFGTLRMLLGQDVDVIFGPICSVGTL